MRFRAIGLLATIGALAVLVGLMAGPATGDSDRPFEDVGQDGPHGPAIEALYWAEVLAGTNCDEGKFCPDHPISRLAMATWLVRVMDGHDPLPGASGQFGDVGFQRLGASHAERLVYKGILETCGQDPEQFCPGEPITRAEAAAALVKAFDLPDGDAPFGFVDTTDTEHEQAIDTLAGSGITTGCAQNPRRFCPDQPITRGQMAALLSRALWLTPRSGQGVESLPTDPELTVGTLENGLTYYLRTNDQPGKSATIRMAVKAGSVNETAPGLGTAHFLEHILFEGTDEYTADELNATLRSIGAELGPDLNAGVWYDDTTYDLTVAADDPQKVSTALHVLSQLAHAATIDPDAVIAERGVVLDEIRLRTTTPNGAISAVFDQVYTDGTPYEGHYPGGMIDAVANTTAQDLRAFYERWYVPSNMAVVVVGDLPVADMEAMVKEHFGPIPPREKSEHSLPEIIPSRVPGYHVATHPGRGYNFISLDFLLPPRPKGATGGLRTEVASSLIEIMVTNRLEDAFFRGELDQVDRPKFESFAHTDGLAYFGTNWQGEDLAAATSAYMSVLETIGKFGFTDSEFTRAADSYTTTLDHWLESAGSTSDRQYADGYASRFLHGGINASAEDRHRVLTDLTTDISPEELTARYRWTMNRTAPLIIAVGPDPSVLPTTSELAAAVESATAREKPPPEEPPIDALMMVPDPVEPISSEPLGLLGAQVWEFANGAKVVFAPSDRSESTVSFQARSLGGWSRLWPGAWALAPRATGAVLNSGFGGLSKLQINRFLGNNTASVGAYIREVSEGFSASANSRDLETAFQIMHLIISEPQVDQVAFAEAYNAAEIRTSLAESNPDWQAWVAYWEAREGLNWYHPVATRDQLASMTPESLLEIFEDRFAQIDNLLVTVVGDIDAETVERLASLYVGTLPAGETEAYVDRRSSPPQGLITQDVAIGAEESAILEMYHETETEYLLSSRVNSDILEAILNDRLFRLVREELGASYVADIWIGGGFVPRHRIESTITISSDPARYAETRDRALEVLNDLAANGPSEAELDQARAVANANYTDITNSTLLGYLGELLFVDDTDDLLTSERILAALEDVTIETVRDLAAALYDTEDRIDINRVPPGLGY